MYQDYELTEFVDNNGERGYIQNAKIYKMVTEEYTEHFNRLSAIPNAVSSGSVFLHNSNPAWSMTFPNRINGGSGVFPLFYNLDTEDITFHPLEKALLSTRLRSLYNTGRSYNIDQDDREYDNRHFNRYGNNQRRYRSRHLAVSEAGLVILLFCFDISRPPSLNRAYPADTEEPRFEIHMVDTNLHYAQLFCLLPEIVAPNGQTANVFSPHKFFSPPTLMHQFLG